MFDARKTLADLRLEPFLFTDMDGLVRQLPNLKTLTPAAVDQIHDGDVLTVLKETVGEDAWEAINRMPIAVLGDLAAAWMKHSESAPGESVASSPSSASTARPSKLTSRGSSTSKTRKR